MADKSEEVQSTDDKIALANELYGTGSRSYLVKSYSDAVDDLSRVCEIFEEVHGSLADELGLPYLMYAKSLIAVAQMGENKIVDIPDEEEDGEQKDAEEGEQKDDEEGGDGDDDDNDDDEEEEAEPQETDKPNGTENGTEGKGTTNGNGTNGTTLSDPQPGTSSLATGDENQEDDDADSDSPAANLQLAWEVLELAVKIFTRQGEPSLSNLADAYFELAEISFENSHFETALLDYINSDKIRMKVPGTDDLRMIALTQYKIGLCHYMNKTFNKSIEAFSNASDTLHARIHLIKAKDDQSEKDLATIAELEELKAEIQEKVAEVKELKEQAITDVQELMVEYLNRESAGQSSSSSALASSSSTGGESSKAEPTNISHLIKRKKPDAVDDGAASAPLAKKPSL